MLWKYLQRSFGGGVIDKELSGRQDLAKYFQGASKIKNLLVRRQGNLQKRRGTDRVAGLKHLLGRDNDGNDIAIGKMRMIPVERDDDGQFMLITGGCAFVGNRDGILLCNGDRVRDIDPYDALDEEGKRKVYYGFDARANGKYPVCIVRNMGASGKDVIWYEDLLHAVANVISGDRVELHGNQLVEETITCPLVNWTLDLYGYKLTVRGGRNGLQNLNVGTQTANITITSSRVGAVIENLISGSFSVINLNGNDSGIANRNVSLTIDGNISWRRGNAYFGGAMFVIANGIKSLTIESGRFACDHTSSADSISAYMINSRYTDTTINGGEFVNDTGNAKVKLINCPRIVTGDVVHGRLTINGGVFIGDNDESMVGREGDAAIFAESVEINGGLFDFTGYSFFFRFTDALTMRRAAFAFGPDNGADEIAYIEQFIRGLAVRNGAFPNGRLHYGWKQEGEADYDLNYHEGDRRPFCVRVPYADEDLARLSVKQVGDTLFIAHHNYPPASIRFDYDGFATIDDIKFDERVWERPVIEAVTMEGNEHKTTSTSTTTVKQYITTESNTTHDGDESRTQNFGEWQEATNSSSTTTVVPESPHTIKYAVTYVKGGFESEMSKPYLFEYMRPWNTGATVKIRFNRGENAEEPDYYNIYKDNGGGFGLIGTTAEIGVLAKDCASLNTERLWTSFADGSTELINASDYEEQVGISAGGLSRRLCSTTRSQFAGATGSDSFVLLSRTNADRGIEFTMTDKTAKSARFWLDARLHDPKTDNTWIVISTPQVRVTVTGVEQYDYEEQVGTDTEGRPVYKIEKRERPRTQSWLNLYATIPPQNSKVNGFIGFRAGNGIYEDFVGLGVEKITLPNGDLVYASFVGKGAQTEWFNTHLRMIDVDFTRDMQGTPIDWVSIDKVKLTFSTSVYSDWTNNQQGCLHAVEFFDQAKARALTGADAEWQDSYITPDMSITPPFEYDTDEHFAGAGDYPSCVGMWGEKAQRLCFASTDNNPLGFWLSCTGDLYNFTRHKSIREDDAIEASIAATEQPTINHIIVIKDLLLLTDGGEWAVTPVTGNVLSYKTVSAKQHSAIGAHRTIAPISVGDEVLFVNRVGEAMSAVRYNAISENYESKELTVLSQNLFRDNPVVSVAFKQHPDSTVECVLKDGTIATLVYMKEHEVVAWSLQELGGGLKAMEIGCTKSILHGTSEMVVSAVKDGEWTILKVKDDATDTAIEHQVCMDAVRDISGEEVKALEDEGMTVIHKITGAVMTQGEIARGEKSVNINDQYLVGHPFESELITVRPEPQGQADTLQMEIKNATEMEVRVIDSTSFRFGANGEDRYLRRVEMNPVVKSAGRIEYLDRDVRLPIHGTNNRDGRIRIVHDEPFAFKLLSVGVTYQVEQANQNGKGGGNEG